MAAVGEEQNVQLRDASVVSGGDFRYAFQVQPLDATGAIVQMVSDLGIWNASITVLNLPNGVPYSQFSWYVRQPVWSVGVHAFQLFFIDSLGVKTPFGFASIVVR